MKTTLPQYVQKWRNDSLFNTNFYLLNSAVISAAAGFIFWMLAARFSSATAIGITTALIASANLILSYTEFGMGAAIIHYTSQRIAQPVRLINTALAVIWVLSISGCIIFICSIPLWASGLSVVWQDFRLLVVFIMFATMNGLLAIYDAAMLARHKPMFVFWRTLACNVPPMILILLFNLFLEDVIVLVLAFCVPNIIVGLVSAWWVMPKFFVGIRFFGKLDYQITRRIATYSLGVHTANLIWGSMAFIMPLIAVNTLDAEKAGYFYIPWAIANLLLIIPRTGTAALFVEGSRTVALREQLVTRTLTLLLRLLLPAICMIWLLGSWVMSLFGGNFIDETTLKVLILSSISFSVNSVIFINLRMQEKIAKTILFSFIVVILIIVLTISLASRYESAGLAWGWTLGHTLVAIPGLLVHMWSRWWKSSEV